MEPPLISRASPFPKARATFGFLPPGSGILQPGVICVTPGLAGAAGWAARPLEGGPFQVNPQHGGERGFSFLSSFPRSWHLQGGDDKRGAFCGAFWGWGWADTLRSDAALTSSLRSLPPVNTCCSARGHLARTPSSTRRTSGSAGDLEHLAALSHLGSDPGFLIHKWCDLQQVS